MVAENESHKCPKSLDFGLYSRKTSGKFEEKKMLGLAPKSCHFSSDLLENSPLTFSRFLQGYECRRQCFLHDCTTTKPTFLKTKPCLWYVPGGLLVQHFRELLAR